MSYPSRAEGVGKYIVLLKIDLVSQPAHVEGLGKYVVLLNLTFSHLLLVKKG